MPRKAGRLRSDALYRVCRSFGARALELAGAETQEEGDRSLGLRLIAYYTHWEGEWSRKRELRDWQGHNLAPLKHKTYRTLTKLFTETIHQNGKPYQLMSHVAEAVRGGAYDFALDLCAEGFESMRTQEHFAEMLLLLQLEATAIEHLEEPDMLSDNCHRMEECLRGLSEVQRLEAARKLRFDPLKRRITLEGGFGKPEVDALQEVILEIETAPPKTKRGRMVYLSMKMACMMLEDQHSPAYATGLSLVALYRENPWLMEEKLTDYLNHLGAVAWQAARCGDKRAATELISELNKSLHSNPIPNLILIELPIRTSLMVGYLFADRNLITQGLALLTSHEKTLAKELNPERIAFIYFRAASGCMSLERWADAYRYLDILMDMKTKIVRRAFINVRVMWLLCQLQLPNGMEMIPQCADAVCKFLRRQEGDQSFLIRVAQTIDKIATIPAYDKQKQQKMAEKMLDDVLRLKDTPTGQSALMVYDYIGFLEAYIRRIKASQ